MTNAYTTGMPHLDALLGDGLQAGTLTLVMGASQAGMTTMLDTITRANAYDQAIPTVFCDRETEPFEHAKRFMASLSGITLEKIQRGRLDHDEQQHLTSALNASGAAPLAFSKAATVDALRLDIVRDPGRPRLVLVDGARFLDRSFDFDPAHDLKVMRSLRELAVGLNAAVVATHPLSSATRGRTPAMADVPSGLAAYASSVLLMHRPDMHDRKVRPGEVDVVCAKSRRGRCGTVSAVGWFQFARLVPLTDYLAA